METGATEHIYVVSHHKMEAALAELGLERLFEAPTRDPFYVVGSLAVAVAVKSAGETIDWTPNDVDVLCSPNDFIDLAVHIATTTHGEMLRAGPDDKYEKLAPHERRVFKTKSCKIDLISRRDPLEFVMDFDLTCCLVAYSNKNETFVFSPDVRRREWRLNGTNIASQERIEKYEARGFVRHQKRAREHDDFKGSCPICAVDYDSEENVAVTILGCGHVVCRKCVHHLLLKGKCPYDQKHFKEYQRLYL